MDPSLTTLPPSSSRSSETMLCLSAWGRGPSRGPWRMRAHRAASSLRCELTAASGVPLCGGVRAYVVAFVGSILRALSGASRGPSGAGCGVLGLLLEFLLARVP